MLIFDLEFLLWTNWQRSIKQCVH